MDYLTAVNNYIVVEPSGDIKGFKELSDARSFDSCYYLDNILENSSRVKGFGTLFDLYQEEDQEDLNRILGVNEGECRVYDLESVIEAIRNSFYFQDEKNELISNLMKEEITLNIYDYGIDNILEDSKIMYSV